MKKQIQVIPKERGFQSLDIDIDVGKLSPETALQILTLEDEALPEPLEAAYVLRKKYKGDVVGIQLLTNARSGNCSQNCAYCAQSRSAQADIAVYDRVSDERLLQDGYTVKEKGLARHCIGLSGIRFSDGEISTLAEQVRLMKRETENPICCSIGFLSPQQAKLLKEAGVDRINHNLNTSRRFYPSICTTHSYEGRLENIRMLQGMGFEICSGGIIGMGETPTDVVDMLFEIQSIHPQAVPINFLIPVEGTALAKVNIAHLTAEYCLKALCLARLLMPESDIRCAAGREVYLKGREREMFCAVDSIFASGYLTADGQGIDDAIRMVTDAGFQYCIEA